jgi:hypothetical protein
LPTDWADWIDETIGFRRLLDWMIDSETQIAFLLSMLFAHLTQLETLHENLLLQDVIHTLLQALSINHEGMHSNIARCFSNFSWNGMATFSRQNFLPHSLTPCWDSQRLPKAPKR